MAKQGDAKEATLAAEIIDVGERIVERSDRVHRINSRLNEEIGTAPRDVVDVLRPEIDRLRQVYPEARVEFHPDPDSDTTASTIPQLGVAFRELFENAIEYHTGETPHVVVSVDTTARDRVVVRVIDENPYIPTRVTDTVTAKTDFDPVNHSTGLGLWITNWIVRRAFGGLSFQRLDPQGNVVTVELDAAPRRSD